MTGRSTRPSTASAPLPKDRVRRLKISAAAWAIGTVLITTLWVVNQWQSNGAFESFGHEATPANGTRRSGR